MVHGLLHTRGILYCIHGRHGGQEALHDDQEVMHLDPLVSINHPIAVDIYLIEQVLAGTRVRNAHSAIFVNKPAASELNCKTLVFGQ